MNWIGEAFEIESARRVQYKRCRAFLLNPLDLLHRRLLVARLLFGSFDLVGLAAHVEGVEEGLGGLDCRFYLGY